ncbi:MAG: NifU family protein [Bdellovibrio sp.]|nr:NifU family protein [Bdellovibrio sp.]
MSTQNQSTQGDVYVSLEFTPNPNTLKYSVNRELLSKGAISFLTKTDAQSRSPLAEKLFDVPGICGVMIGKNFVTVTKTEDGDWDVVHKKTSSTIHDHLTESLPVVNASVESEEHKGGDSEIENKIRQILDQEIRPAVAMDGGDITFEKFEDGIVYLFLQGACSGCPSSTATLKMGIETRLREAIPEVTEVVSV